MTHLIAEHQIHNALTAAGLSYVEELNPQLPAQLSIWLSMMLASPRNLTAIKDPEAAISKHVIEPLAMRHRLIAADLPVPHGIMLDLGSGNGSPGLPIALCEPQRNSVLLDSRAAPIAFLTEVLAEIEASHVSTLHERAEVVGHADLRERCALVISRALAPPTMALELMMPFLEIGGIGVAMTGALAKTETQRVTRTLSELGAAPASLDPPADNVVAIKLEKTNNRYPRPWSQIRRQPLGTNKP